MKIFINNNILFQAVMFLLRLLQLTSGNIIFFVDQQYLLCLKPGVDGCSEEVDVLGGYLYWR